MLGKQSKSDWRNGYGGRVDTARADSILSFVAYDPR